ncbi:phage minor capsid protein [Bacillus pseudomycoides]|uniref:phage minor capsid protein n=1 Tax=Bacillus pseudomycoides TaxID=64104 RepID=UPI000BF7E9B1|nr:phage minor capsid protein [Bacillus pseudomycoides]PEP88572.1 minor capsid protein [Bacillus pseudomycoides]
MALPPEKLLQLSLFVVDIYNAIEEELFLNMARLLKRDMDLLLTAENNDQYQHWRMVQLNKLGTLDKQQLETIAKHSGKTVKEVRTMLQNAGSAAIGEHESIYTQAVKLGLLEVAPPTAQSAALIGILNAYVNQALNTLNLVNTTMLNHAQQMYRDVLNQTVGKLLAGTITQQQAIRQAVAGWANKGIPAFVDKLGRKWSTEAYVSTVCRSTSNNVANEMQDERMKEYGVDLVETSSHMGARPKCAPYQGRIFSMSGKSKKYPAWSTTSYGDPAGLLGVNCRHLKFPYIPGVSTQRYKPYDYTENDKAYKESQQQRSLERQIKKAKREVKVLEAIGDKEGVKLAKNKVSQRQANMRDFIKATGRKRQPNREQIV